MTARNGSTICDTKLVRHKYEMLRANALGTMNRASEFTVFLRNGMSAWIRATGGGHATCRFSGHSDRRHPRGSEAGKTLRR